MTAVESAAWNPFPPGVVLPAGLPCTVLHTQSIRIIEHLSLPLTLSPGCRTRKDAAYRVGARRIHAEDILHKCPCGWEDEDARLSDLGTSTCRQGAKIKRSSRRGVIVSGFYLFFVAVAVLAIGLVLKPTPAIHADECSGGGSDTGGGDHGEIGPAGNGSSEVSDVSINGLSIGSSDMIGVTDRRIIMVLFTGLATDYRISENPDFAGAEWQEIPRFGCPAIEI